MKRFLSFLTLATLLCTAASAQNNLYRSVIGPYIDANGAVAVADPSTTIVVDLVIESEQTIVGPYARYAQKYLDVRGSLVEKTTFTIKDARLSVLQCDGVLAPAPEQAASTTVQSHLGDIAEFAKVLPDRMSTSPLTIEDAAAQAAQSIFTIRKKRMDLITGDAGENVFGAGLKDALEALDAREQAYLELFLGKKVTTTSTKRIVVPLNGTESSYTIAKLSSSKGLLAESAEEGDAVKLVINPSGRAPKLNGIAEVDSRDKTALMVRLADNATCSISVGDAVVGTTTLPVFEFGRTAYIANTVVKR
ncbi:MAG: DUF4831 family protein [Alistipes sp.]|nr:DUF4831 family protein [Alistipes sp.]MBO5400043.1 DUF4831 family protein [Alistipes sp.]